MEKRKIILFGGTFDPIHLGHTAVADEAAKHIGAEKIIFIPAKCSPLKKFYPEASDEERLAMIALAITGHKNFEVSNYELKKSEQSYTLQTIRRFQADYGSDTLIYWPVGADSVDDLPRWYGIEELIDECNLCVMFRAGFDQPNFNKFKTIWGPGRVKKLQKNVVPTSLIDISSTEIRRRLAVGGDISNMVCPAVAEYIRKHGLYKSKGQS